ncbi:MAG: RluA family pseudouridine synthase [Bacilli bacterium]|jgi:23S rRNA pseudouridine1911/1915/1917 synthase|nr:RluA family pseudouridine synthase [Bacilli bacterium]
MAKKTLKASEALAGQRLDEALFSLGAAPSRSKVQSMIKDCAVTVNDKVEKPHYQLRYGDIVNYEEYTEKPLELKKQDIPLDIVYEDDDIIVVNKQAGLTVHPGNGHEDGTLLNGLLFHESALAPAAGAARPGLVHRIDKDTSGLLVVAKNDFAYEGLSAQLVGHSMHREYYALVKGLIGEDEAKIDAPIGRDPKNPLKFAVVGRGGKESVTFFKVLKRFPNDGCTLVSCRLLTGRTHQIRVHMTFIGHPVIGDPLYGAGNRKLYDNGQLLHAYRLTFVHPRTKKEVSFTAPLPDYFENVLSKLT